MSRKVDLTNKRFGMLTVLRAAPLKITKKYTKARWECLCDCGKTCFVLAESLAYGNTKSCGCLRKTLASERGKTKAKEICKHGYPRVPGNYKDCDCPVRIRQKKSASLKCLYGITLEQFDSMIEDQGRRCLGCRSFFHVNEIGVYEDACLDHEHASGKIRGALCKLCNKALGCVRESPETMRRLIAYLDRDINVPLVYVVGRLKNRKIVSIANLLRQEGFDVFEDWNYCGPDADDWWQKSEKARGRNYFESLEGRAAQNTFLFDKSYLDLANAVVVVAPAGKSAFMEMGYSKGNGKPVFILLPKGSLKRYEVMTKFADGVYETLPEILEVLKEKFKERLKKEL